MRSFIRKVILILTFTAPMISHAAISVGVGKSDITPPLGTPSAGYSDRKGEGMSSVHDPLMAIALTIDNEEKTLVLCSVDHLGFTYDMVREIDRRVRLDHRLASSEIYIGSSHTHSGGGAYMDIPYVGEMLAGPYSQETTAFYIEKTVEAIVQSSQHLVPAKLGIGYGNAEELSRYRSQWPTGISALTDVAVIKVTALDDTPLAVFFNYPLHPTVLKSHNRSFSSDFVGYARDHLQALLGPNVQALYFNGAQGEIIPAVDNQEEPFSSCESIGHSLAKTVAGIWNTIETNDELDVATQTLSYSFKPLPTPYGLALPLDSYQSEMSVIVLNREHAFLVIPGELSTVYDRRLKEVGKELGYENVSILGLTNDSHGYILLPEAWRHKTSESGLSFGGEFYGEFIQSNAEMLLKENAP